MATETPATPKTSAPAADTVKPPSIASAATTDAEAAGHVVAEELSRFRINGWLALAIAVVANVLGILTHF